MKRICIINDNSLSVGNGVGRYLKEFENFAFRWRDINFIMIVFRTSIEQISFYTRRGMDYLFIPRTICDNPFEDCETACVLLRQYVVDEKDMFFLFNYTPCNKLMHEVRKYFPASRFINIVHDFCWVNLSCGNIELLRESVKTAEEALTGLSKEILDYFRLEQECYEMADLVVCLSEDSYRLLRNYYLLSEQKIALIPNGIENIQKPFYGVLKQKWKQEFYLRTDEKIILIVGRISRTKGVFTYLNAFKKVLKENPNCRLVIVGDLYNAPDLLCSASEIVCKITLTGRLTQEQLSYWYRIADIGVIPSYSEQCSYVGLEMMSYGLPVVASDAFGVKCMFQNGINALTACIGERSTPEIFAQNLADSTLHLLNNPNIWKKLQDNARRILKEKYTFEAMEKHYKAIFMA